MSRCAIVLAALAALLAPAAAHADPITFVALAAPYIGGTLAAFIASNAVTIGFIAVNVFGAAAGRRKQRAAANRARAAAAAALQDRSALLLQAIPAQRVIYGRCIVGGDIVAIFASDKTGYRQDGTTYTKPDAYKHLVIALASHQVQAINEVYIEGVAVGTLDGSGWPTSGDFYRDTAAVTQSRTVMIGPGASLTVPEPVLAILSAYYSGGVGIDISYTDVTPTLSGGNTIITNPNGTFAIEVNYTIATSSAPRGTVRIQKHLGTAGQTVDTYLNSVVPTQWTTDHRLRGIAYVVLTLDLEEQRFQGGPPQVTFDVSGKLVYDPRTTTTAWSHNPALIVRDFLLAAHGFECVSGDIDDASCIAAANACDALISLTVGGVTTTGQHTYTCNGTFTTDESREAVLEDLCESMAGFAAYGAKWQIFAGAWTLPVLSLSDDDLDGQIEIVQAGAGIDDLFNGVRGTYVPAGKASPTDFNPPYQNSTFVTADGRELWSDIALPFTDNAARARNLARIFTERNRDGQIISYPAKLKAWPLQIGDRVTVTSAEYGFSAKTFRVTDWQFGATQAVQLTLQEDGASVWDLADAADADPNPNTDLPNPWVVAPLTGLAAASGGSHVLRQADGTIVPRVWVSWNAVTDAYVADGSGYIVVRWLRPGSTTWQRLQTTGDETGVYIVGPKEGDRLTIEAYAVNGIGARGGSVFIAHTVAGKATAASNVSGFTSSVSNGVIVWAWNRCQDADYGSTEIRSSNADWGSTSVEPLFRGKANAWNEVVTTAATYTRYAKHIDQSGNVSATAASRAQVVTTEDLGSEGAPGKQAGTPTVYRWDASIPAGPSGSATYTWATGAFGSAPSGWALTPGTSPSPGYTLWGAAVTLISDASVTTTAFNWVSASITARGVAGADGAPGTPGADGAPGAPGDPGASSRYCYQRVPGNPAPTSGYITTSGSTSFPTSTQSNTTWGINQAWVGADPNPSSTNTLYQADGIYSPSTGNTVWSTPYISSLKVGTLSAITVNTGALTVQDVLTIATSGVIKSGQTAYDTGTGYWLEYNGGVPRFSLGSSTKGIRWDGSNFYVRGSVIGTSNVVANAIVGMVSGDIVGTGRSTTTTTSRTTTVTIGSIATDPNGSGRVTLFLSQRGQSSVAAWNYYGLMMEGSVNVTGGYYCTIRFRFERNGVGLRDFGATDLFAGDTQTRFGFPQIINDTPGAGVTATYTMKIYTTSGTSAGATNYSTQHAHEIVNFSYVLMELKR